MGNSAEAVRVWESGYQVGQRELASSLPCDHCPMKPKDPDNVVSFLGFKRSRTN